MRVYIMHEMKWNMFRGSRENVHVFHLPNLIVLIWDKFQVKFLFTVGHLESYNENMN